MSTVAAYKMNPAEDDVLFGTQLEEGMWVLCEFPPMRRPYGDSEDDQIRAQCFRQVTNLQRSGDQVVFIGRWIDGYAEVHKYHATYYGWIVKRDVALSADAELHEITGVEAEQAAAKEEQS